MNSHDVLQPISEFETHKICDILKKEWPNSIYAYCFLKTCSRWKQSGSEIDISFFHRSDNLQSGIFVGIIKSNDNVTNAMITYAMKGYDSLLRETLLRTKAINWNSLPRIEGISNNHAEILRDVLQKKGFDLIVKQEEVLFTLEPENFTKNARVPDDVTVRQLTSDHVDAIYNTPSIFIDYLPKDFIDGSIKLNAAFGVFSKTNDVLLAWIMQIYDGSVAVYVDKNHRRMNYGKLLGNFLAEKIFERGDAVLCVVNVNNRKSLHLNTAFGNKVVALTKFCKTEKAKESRNVYNKTLSSRL